MSKRSKTRLDLRSVVNAIEMKNETFFKQAEEYNMTPEEFESSLELAMERSKFRQLKKRSARNEKIVVHSDVSIPDCESCSEEEKVTIESGEEMKKNNLDYTSENLEDVDFEEMGLEELQEAFDKLHEKMEATRSEARNLANDVYKLRHIFFKQEEIVTFEQRKLENLKMELAQKRENHEAVKAKVGVFNAKLSKIRERITCLENNKLYLISPNYSGEIPEKGVKYSVVSREGTECIEIPEEYRDIVEENFDNMRKANYDSLSEYSQDMKFVKLIFMMFIEDRACKILADERVEKLISLYKADMS